MWNVSRAHTHLPKQYHLRSYVSGSGCACWNVRSKTDQLPALQASSLRFDPSRTYGSACTLSRVCAQIGLVWMELLRLGDGGKRLKLGVDLTPVLSELVPTLRLKKSQCV